MSDTLCLKQETCPLLLGAIEAKVKAEATLRVETANYEAKRKMMNTLFSLARKCRLAQKDYFASRTNADLVKSRVAERQLDACIAQIIASATEERKLKNMELALQ